MKLRFMKEFDGDMTKLPQRIVEGATQFCEPENMNTFGLIANAACLVLSVACLVPVILVSGGFKAVFEDFWKGYSQLLIALALCLAILPVHECVHAGFFKGEVRFYTYLKKGMMFVVGTEDMTKLRFVMMSLMPSIAFGLIPFVLFFIFPSQLWLGLTGAFNIGAGTGDYINVFNALTQMPKGSLTYMSGHHSFWYIPSVKQEGD